MIFSEYVELRVTEYAEKNMAADGGYQYPRCFLTN